jgi:hypothetical protein
MAVAIVFVGWLTGCSFGDIANGPLPVDVTDEQITGTWHGSDGAGTFVFSANGTVSATDLPSKAMGEDADKARQGRRWSGTGHWRITYPPGGDPKQRNIVELSFDEVDGVAELFFTRMSASRPDDRIMLGMTGFGYTKDG